MPDLLLWSVKIQNYKGRILSIQKCSVEIPWGILFSLYMVAGKKYRPYIFWLYDGLFKLFMFCQVKFACNNCQKFKVNIYDFIIAIYTILWYNSR